MKLALAIFAASLSWGQCSTDSNGICITGLSAVQNNIVGPLIPYGASPWVFGDLAEKGVTDNMAPAALAHPPALGSALSGTVSWTQGDNHIATTSDLAGALAGQSWVAATWTTVDGAGTGRLLCPISSVTSSVITCSEFLNEPTTSGASAYLLPPPVVINGNNIDFQSWTTENPSTVWNYYGVDIGLNRLGIRTNNTTYHTYAQQYEDIQWQWVLDHGYRRVAPRASAMLGQFFRTFEGHSERLPGLYNWITLQVPIWANPAASPDIDNREAGYMLWDIALGAKVDTDPTRHAQYCSWLSTYTNTWNSVQWSDGSFPEAEYNLNQSYVSAPKTFTAPFQYQGAPWREAINVKSLEAAYESLNDTSSQGCNNPTLAATTLTTITNAVTWQWNFGRDTSNRGIFYEVNSQSDDQDSVSPASGTVSVNVSSTSVVGVSTNWNTAGYCDGHHFIGITNALTVYKIASCADDTHLTLSVAFGLYGEGSNVSGSQYGIAPSAFTGCHSAATYCFGQNGDRNLERTVPGEAGWLYAQTLNATYLAWTNELLSAQLGGPTAGLTTAANLGSITLPCSGPACDGLVTDTVAAAASCYTQPAPCVYGSYLYTNLGKNFGEAFGAPGIDNALAWRLLGTSVAPTITTTSPLSGGTLNVPYSFQFTANGTAPITWSATGLPAWASLSSSGLLTGTPSASATTIIAVNATNAAGTNGPINFSLTIAGIVPTITSSSPLPGGTNGTAYSFQFTASGSTPITWGATGLPGWATLSSGGLLTGTPNVNTTTIIAVTATNSTGNSGPQNFSITVIGAGIAPTITSSSPLPNGVLGTAYSFQFSANGTAPITWSAMGLPSWASLSSTGLLTGTPNAVTVSTLAVTATNGTGSDGPHPFSLTIPGVAPTITSLSPLPGGVVGTAYSYQFAASGTPTITWTASGLPSWASLSSSGLLTGTPNVSALNSFTVTATNATGNSGAQPFSLTIVVAPVGPIITSTSPLPAGTVGIPYSFTFAATGTAPITWSATGLPSWVSLSMSGLLTGTPSSAATTIIAVTATNIAGTSGPTNFSLTIVAPSAPPAIVSVSPLPSGVIGIPYSYTFTATGATPITWTGTSLPSWASLSSAGAFTGSPTAAATTTFNVTAANIPGSAGPTAFSITIAAPPPVPTCSPASHLSPPGATDIQLQVNMALAVTACTNSLTGNGCSVVDVQRVINAALGGACVVGP